MLLPVLCYITSKLHVDNLVLQQVHRNFVWLPWCIGNQLFVEVITGCRPVPNKIECGVATGAGVKNGGLCG
jgi:hypothetical protein